MKKIILASVIMMFTMVTACSSSQGMAKKADIYQKTFYLVYEGEWSEFENIRPEIEEPAYMQINHYKKVNISSRCNTIAFDASINVYKEVFMTNSDIVKTENSCGSLSKLENKLIDAVNKTQFYNRDDNYIELLDSSKNVLVKFALSE